MSHRRVSMSLIGAACAVAIAAAGLLPMTVSAAADEYSFYVSYRAYLSGIRVGKGSLAGRFKGAEYRLTAAGEVSGIARLFGRYEGSSEARGSLSKGAESFRAQGSGDGEALAIQLKLDGDRVRDVKIEPAPKPHSVNHPARVRLTKEHQRGVIDPLRALVTPGGFDGARFDRSTCEQVVPVFSGGERFDLALSFREIRTVTAPRSKGYSGPVMVCDARYVPVAGHRSDRSTVRYLRDEASIEVMLAPVPGSDVLVPFRVTVSTPFGPAVLQSQNIFSDGTFAARAAIR